MNLRDFIGQHPNAAFNMMTPVGYVYLTAENAKALLEGVGTTGHPGDPEMAVRIDAEEILTQTIISSNLNEGVWHLFTGSEE